MKIDALEKTHFDCFHFHKWSPVLRQNKHLSFYESYWKNMVIKMLIAQELVLEYFKNLKNEIKIDEKNTEELKKLFLSDAEKIIDSSKFTDMQRRCFDYRVSEHCEIVKTAFLFREISGRLGIKALREAAENLKKEFALRLQKVTSDSIGSGIKKKLSFRYMLGDHFIKIEKNRFGCRLIFFNCPLYGVFKHLGFMAEGEIFCRLCEAHGEIMTKSNIPIKHVFSLKNSLCSGSDRCEFMMSITNPASNFLIKCFPEKTINFLLGLSEPNYTDDEV